MSIGHMSQYACTVCEQMSDKQGTCPVCIEVLMLMRICQKHGVNVPIRSPHRLPEHPIPTETHEAKRFYDE